MQAKLTVLRGLNGLGWISYGFDKFCCVQFQTLSQFSETLGLVQFACKYTHIRVYLYYCHYSFVFHKTLRIKTFVSLFIKFVHDHDEVKRKISTIVTNGRRKSNFCIHSLLFHYWLHYWLHYITDYIHYIQNYTVG